MTRFLSSLLVIGGLLTNWQLPAQTLQAGAGQLTFGNVLETAPATQQVTITNPLNYSVKITAIRFFTTFGEPAFSVANTFPVTIAANGSQVFTVTFAPKHNIAHNSEMVIETDSHGGHLSVDLLGQGKYSRSYYNSTENKSEEPLKIALKAAISSPYTSFSYNVARDKMYEEVDNWKVNGRGSAVNKLECVYTGRVVTGYTNRSDLFNTHSINAEHTFPQGKFGSAAPMVSDMHHLFPTDEAANNSRSSYPFGVATTPYKNDNLNNPSHLGANLLYEPRNLQKGASARAMLYFVIRYQDYQNFFAPQEAILKTWNHDFTPTAVDVKRNDDIQARQQNRNPFVDYPQLADRITNFVSTSAAANNYELYQAPFINYGQVPANTPYTFSYVLVNNGNQTMNFSNATLSKPSILSFAPGSGGNFAIAPGEAYTIKVKLTTTNADSVSEMLTLATNIPGKATLNVPVYANKKKVSGPLSAAKDLETARFNLYPNPVMDELIVARGNMFGAGTYHLEIMDAVGRTVLRTQSQTDLTSLDVAELKRGVYFVRISAGELTSIQKFVKL